MSHDNYDPLTLTLQQLEAMHNEALAYSLAVMLGKGCDRG
jgi:hypothetical protein